MASSWMPPQHHPSAAERPWLGMAMLAAVPLISLLLIRMLWSGSSLWFLTVGLILLGAAAVVFLARRPQDDYGHHLAPESNRLPLVLTGLGVLFLAMLLLPNFASGGASTPTTPITELPGEAVAPAGSEVTSDVAGAASDGTTASSSTTGTTTTGTQSTTGLQPANAPTSVPVVSEPPVVEGETYVVVEGDTLWDIAALFGTTVDEIVAANGLSDPEDIAIGDELIIPYGSGSAVAEESGEGAGTE